MSFHAEAAGDAWDDWKRGDVPVDAVTAELHAIVRAAFAAAQQLRADNSVVEAKGDPFDTARAQINALPEANDS